MFGENKISRKSHGFEIVLDVCLFEDEGNYIAHCPALDISSYGTSEDEAQELFNEAVTIFLDEVEKKGTLENVLLDLGWQLKRKPKVDYRPPIHDITHTKQFQQYCGKANTHFNTTLTLPVE